MSGTADSSRQLIDRLDVNLKLRDKSDAARVDPNLHPRQIRDAGMCMCSAQSTTGGTLLEEPRKFRGPEHIVGGEVGDARVHEVQRTRAA
jgi:hypothetical protein